MSRRAVLSASIAVGVCLGRALYKGNNDVVVTEYEVSHTLIPKSFDGFKLAHISDLHGCDSPGLRNGLLRQLKTLSLRR